MLSRNWTGRFSGKQVGSVYNWVLVGLVGNLVKLINST